MINLDQATADAATCNVLAYIANGRFKLEGACGNVRKVLAAQGLSLIREGTYSTVCRDIRNNYVGMLLSMNSDFAYFYTAEV